MACNKKKKKQELLRIVRTKEMQVMPDETGKLNIKDFLFHHKSKQEWEFKILKSMNQFSNTYIVNNKENKSTSCIRLVNEDVIGKKLKPNTGLKRSLSNIIAYDKKAMEHWNSNLDSLFTSEKK